MSPLRSTVADVDLDAIAYNLQQITPPGYGSIAVVKADAYGHGAEAVSSALVEAGAAMLAVLTTDEAAMLRCSGIAAPILVLGGLTDAAEADSVVALDLTMTVWDARRARMLSETARAAGKVASVHFKVDTGLTRLGSPLATAVQSFGEIARLPSLAIDGIFTHFANADLVGDTFTAVQARRFEEVLSALRERPRLVHAAASAGVTLLAGRVPGNAVRPGLALYGLHSAPHLATVALRPALRWSSRVGRVVEAAAGTGVGYDHEYRLPRDGRIATVPVGYGDGLPRSARGKMRLLVRGRALPVAGRISMDSLMLDVTEVPEVREGDEVVLIGEQDGIRLTAEDLASAIGTINYEVVTSIRRRVSRRYLRSGRLVATRTLAEGLVWA